MFQYDLHVHTALGSACGKSSGTDMVNLYRSRSYAGIVVTDHFYHGNTAPSRDLTWEDYIREYTAGYDEALAASGDDFSVFFGIEERLEGFMECIVLGITPQWLQKHPEIRDLVGVDFLRAMRDAGFFVIHVHPFRDRPYMGKDPNIYLYPDDVDAIEVRNLGNSPEQDRLALEYARELRLPMVGGSDNHNAEHPEDKPLCGVTLPFRVRSAEDLIAAIRAESADVIGLGDIMNLPLGEASKTLVYKR